MNGKKPMIGLAGQVLTGRWLMLFASLLLMVTAGASYMFGLYSNDIKSVLGYDQTTLNMVSFSKDLGASFGLFAGLVNEVAPPWVVLSIGAVLNFFGNFMVWLAVVRKIPVPRVWQLCVYIAVGANSHTFTNTGALVTCVTNFPGSRGVVLGLLKGYTGISAAVIAQLYRGLYGGDSTKSFTLFVAWLPTALSFASLGTIRVLGPRGNYKNCDDDDLDMFYKLFYMSLCLAAYLLVIIIVEGSVSFDRAQYGFSAVVVLFLLFLPLIVVVSEEYKLLKLKKKDIRVIDNKSLKIKKESPTTDNKEGRWWENALKPPAIGDNFTILQAVLSVEMLTLVLSTVCGIGGNMTMIDNLGQIGASFGYPQRKITNFVSLTSIWNYLGQVTAGFLSEALITKYKFPRPIFLTLVLLFSSVGHLLVAFNVPNGLYAASIIIGFCFGAIWPLIYTIISELFGLKYYSTLYNIGPMSTPVGLYLLNVKVAGNYYDREARKQLEARGLSRRTGQALSCLGGECFRLSFIIISVVTLFGAVVSLVLVARTREFYKGDIYERFRNDDVALAREVDDGGGAKAAGNDSHVAVV